MTSLMRPDRIQSASKVTSDTVALNRSLVRTGKFDLDRMLRVRNRPVSLFHARAAEPYPYCLGISRARHSVTAE